MGEKKGVIELSYDVNLLAKQRLLNYKLLGSAASDFPQEEFEKRSELDLRALSLTLPPSVNLTF